MNPDWDQLLVHQLSEGLVYDTQAQAYQCLFCSAHFAAEEVFPQADGPVSDSSRRGAAASVPGAWFGTPGAVDAGQEGRRVYRTPSAGAAGDSPGQG